MSPDKFEETIALFEQELVLQREPDIYDFVDRAEPTNELFVELLHTDLELRIRNDENIRVEHYIDRFPKVANDRQLIHALMRTELRVRQKIETGLDLHEFVERFPDIPQTMVEEFGIDLTIASDNKSNIDQKTKNGCFSDNQSRFRKRRLHQQGGIGNVWLARDMELNRQVAIKEIKPKYCRSSSHRSRFARETRITTKLEHPGIVPIYGLGQLSDGTPYFAMQFVNGKTFKKAIAEFQRRGRESDNSAEFELEFHRLLQHFLNVCNTVQYAHTQGVIHRDLKPANIMIGQFGETFVVDWGLAKISNDDEHGSVELEETNQSNNYDVDTEIGCSVAGKMIGSPGFMSPEQIEGDLTLISETSDVYGLGATLLTLISSSTGSNSPKISAKYRRLESICKKAMSDETADRYQTARELANDVENFILDHTVVAHRDSAWDRTLRFARRYRGILNAAMVAFVLLALVSTSAAIWINAERAKAISAEIEQGRQRQKAEDALKIAERAKTKAEARTSQLTKTVDMFVAMFTAKDERGVNYDLNKVTMQQAFDRMNSKIELQDDPIAKAFWHTASARNNESSGNFRLAVEQYEHALRSFDEVEIGRTDPLYVNAMFGLCNACFSFGNSTKAARIAEQIIALCGDKATLEKPLTNTLILKLKILLRQEKIQQASEVGEQAYVLAEKIHVREPKNNLIYSAIFNRAKVQRLTGNINESIVAYESIIDRQETLGIVNRLKISSRLKLAENELLNQKFEAATAIIAAAYEESIDLLGESHAETISVKSRYGAVLAADKNPLNRMYGLVLLEECRAIQIDQREYYTAMQTSTLFAHFLLANGNNAEKIKAAYVLEECLELVELDRDSPDAQGMRTAYVVLFRACEQAGDLAGGIKATERSIFYSKQLFGIDADQTKALIARKQELDNQLSAKTDATLTD